MSQRTQDRRWVVDLEYDGDGYPLDRQFEQDVAAAMSEVAVILLRLGGAVKSYAVRRQDEQTGLWHPVQVVLAWSSFVPGIRPQRAPVEPLPSVDDVLESDDAEPEVDVEPEDTEPADAA